MRARIPSTGTRAVRRLGDLLLTLLAAGGALCIVLVILSVFFSISIMMFRTGSMSPTITAGSIALVREIPAVEMSEGDVVTVDRGEGMLPVTHRVVEIRARDSTSGEVTFTMQGDANDVPDPDAYSAVEVRRVMFSVPGAAGVVQWFGDPLVLGALTLGAATLVVWAFWPRADDPDGGLQAVRSSSPREPPSHTAFGVPALAALVLAAPALGHADVTLTTGEHLRIQTEGDPGQMQNLAPGDSAVWEVGIWAEAPEPGEIRLGLTGRGDLVEAPGALLVTVDSCGEPWRAETCRSGPTTLLDEQNLADIAAQSRSHHLAAMPSDQQRWLRITVTLSEAAGLHGLEGARGDVLIHAAGAGEHLTSAGPSPVAPEVDGEDGRAADGAGLARTGAAGLLSVVVAALVLGIVGAALGWAARRSGSSRPPVS
ncbi:signal peptidase I [Brachybacterium sp. YJGR34]|uniref:signal peptidase I n=1 Tax=Brachybacterium sp. YJGR34 TaxID=2059911 RepID=UPI000E0A3D0C|nr:signal peptidase I [Brachybacterium sp. YJGR34]